MSRIPILHLCDSPFVGGPERQILGQCAHIDRDRFQPMVASFTEFACKGNDLIKVASEQGIQTVQICDGKISFPLAVRQLTSAIKQYNIRAMISSGFKANFTACCATAIASIPYIAYFHGHTGITTRVKAYEALDKLAMRRARLAIVVCEAAADALRRSGVRKVAVIPNAVNAAEIAADGTQALARRALRINDDEMVIGTVARLSVEKGINYLIDAASIILEEYPSVKFVIIGDGPTRSGLEQQAADLGVSDRLIFAGFRRDSTRLMKAFDIFALPSLRENMPVSLLEAMACGIPVVATDVGGVREILAPAGIEPVSPCSPRAIAKAILALLNDDDLRARQSDALLNRVEYYSFERQTALMDSHLRELRV